MAREYQTWNRGDSYFDMLMEQMMFDEQYPRGATEQKKIGGEWETVPVAPEWEKNTWAESEAKSRVKGKASLKEDQALRGALGSSRKLREGENIPGGSYALAKYPGMDMDLWIADAGGVPRGYGIQSFMGETPQERQERMQKQKEWANAQRAAVGMNQIPWGTDAYGMGRRR